MVILGILFFATALVSGVVANGFLVSQNSDEQSNKLLSKILKNNEVIVELEDSVQLLGHIENSRIENNRTSLDIAEVLSNLEEQIERLKEENEDLEDQMNKVKNNIQKVYALFPIGPY